MEVVIILSHGSKSKNSNVLTQKVAAEVAKTLGIRTIMANLQLSPPYLSDVIDAEYRNGVRKFIIHPFFLHRGVHVEKDIPDELEGFKKEYSDVTFVMTTVTGDHPFIARAVAEIIKGSV